MALAGRMLAEALDRRHALWEICLVEGLRMGASRCSRRCTTRWSTASRASACSLSCSAWSPPTRRPLAPPPHAIEAPARTDRLAASLLADGARGSRCFAAREEFVHPAEALQHAKELGEGLAEILRDGLTPAFPKTSRQPR